MHENLSTGALTLFRGGFEEIFTPMFFFVARKPLGAATPSKKGGKRA